MRRWLWGVGFGIWGTTTITDLTVTQTNTYNPYVIMPVPNGIH